MQTAIIKLLALLLLLPALPARAAVAVDSARCAIALVNIPVAHLRAAPAHSSEMVTQAMLGSPVELLDSAGEWLRVRLPDTYTGFIHSSSVTPLTPSQFRTWQSSPRLVALCHATADITADTLSAGKTSYLLHGAIVAGSITPGSAYAAITLPDGTSGYAPAAALTPLDSLAARATDTRTVIATASAALGAPYLWGGTTLLAPDCSGLVKRAYFATGIILPRDASQQALVGIPVPHRDPSQWQRGDLLFFSGSDPRKITHVAIYDTDTRFIHASGKVFVSSVNPADPLWIPRPVVKVMRIAGAENTPGITRIASHPLYFSRQ